MNAKSAAQAVREAGERLVAECARASTAQWLFRPALDAWSMSHVAEHVAIANGNLHALLAKRLLASPLEGRTPDVLDLEIPYVFYRGDEPPNVGKPTGTWTDPRAALEKLAASAHAIVAWGEATDADLRRFGAPHPAFGLLDGVQWLLFAAAHMERHRSQVIGLRRAPAHPA